MNTSASASSLLGPTKMNVWVSHSNALVRAGLVATMRKLRGCEVLSNTGHNEVFGAATPLNVDVVIADSIALAKSFSSEQQRADDRRLPKPQIVLLTTTSDGLQHPNHLPAGISACLSVDCGQDDLLNTVCGLFGVSRSALQASPSDWDADLNGSRAAMRPRGGIAPSALRRVRDTSKTNSATTWRSTP